MSTAPKSNGESKLFRSMFGILFGILSGTSIGFGVLCILYHREAEGFIMIGCSLLAMVVLSVMYISSRFPDVEKLAKKAGTLLVELVGVVRIDGGRGENAVLSLYESGIYLDTDSISFQQIPYDKAILQESHSVHHIQFWFESIGVCRFTCDNKLKVKAIYEVCAKKGLLD